MTGSEIAIIGMAGRFPGAATVDALWSVIREGIDVSVELTDWPHDNGVGARCAADSRLVRRAFLLDGYDEFDADFFRLAPADAELLDPQQRVFLEVAWETFEDAGYVPDAHSGTIGVYAGMGAATYALQAISRNGSADYGLKLLISNDKDYLSARVAYHLDLKGPCVSIQAACASSLTAVHVAAQALLGFECDIALAGGVSIRLPHRSGYLYREGGILSSDGRCRAFDKRASGTAYGSGAAAVLLKRLDEAVRDRDHIHAVLRGSALTHDGSMKVGFTAPGVDGQVRAIREALAVAHVDPISVGYVEAHGTGTPLGDPIEIAALREAFSGRAVPRASCAIGSIKSNIGHLDAAAGVTGLIKACLAVEHGIIPPATNVEIPNPELQLSDSPFHLPSIATAWRRLDGPRRAGVSSIGMGGSNVHAVVEERPTTARHEDRRDDEHLIILSARSPKALTEMWPRLLHALRSASPPLALRDVAFTLQTGRKALPFRRAVPCRDQAELIAALESEWHIEVPVRALPEILVQLSVDDLALKICGHLELREGWLRQARNDFDELVGAGRVATDDGRASIFAAHWMIGRMWQSWLATPVRFCGDDLAGLAAKALAGLIEPRDALDQVGNRRAAVLRLDPGSSAPTIEAAGRWSGTGSPRRALLTALGEAWTAGAEIRWNALHSEAVPRRVPLPTYPFERRRYWLGALAQAQDASPHIDKPETPRVYAFGWRQLVLGPDRMGRSKLDFRPTRWLVVGPDIVSAGVARGLLDAGAQAQTVATLDAAATTEWASTLADASDTLGVVDLRPLMAAADTAPAHLFAEATALVDVLRDRPGAIRHCVVASGIFDVTGDEPLRPELAVLRGVVKVLPQEDPRFATSLIDLVPGPDACNPVVLSLLVLMLVSHAPPRETALRGRNWFVPFYEVLPDTAAGASRLRHGGSYVVTGGLGQIGSALARHLAHKFQARLTLIGRTIDNAHEAIAGVEAVGGAALAVAADIADAGDLAAALTAARQRFGAINGVIHCAGVPSFGLLQSKTRESVAAVLAPKIAGARNLLSSTCSDNLDFIALFSSMSAVFGGIGQADYSSANAFLGALAESRAREGGPFVCCLDWDAWETDSWIERGLDAAPELRSVLVSERRRTGLGQSEGLALFEQALATGHPHVVISRQRPEGSVAWHDGLVRSGMLGRFLRPQSRLSNPNLVPSPMAAYSGLSRARLAHIVAEILNVSEVEEDAELHAIGLHSLLAVDLATRISAEVRFEVPLRWILDFPSVARLADRISRVDHAVERPDHSFLDILGDIEAMSPEEVSGKLCSLSDDADGRTD